MLVSYRSVYGHVEVAAFLIRFAIDCYQRCISMPVSTNTVSIVVINRLRRPLHGVRQVEATVAHLRDPSKNILIDVAYLLVIYSRQLNVAVRLPNPPVSIDSHHILDSLHFPPKNPGRRVFSNRLQCYELFKTGNHSCSKRVIYFYFYIFLIVFFGLWLAHNRAISRIRLSKRGNRS